MRVISQKGIVQLRRLEKVRLKAFRNQWGRWTIGYNEYLWNTRPIIARQVITLQSAEDIFAARIQANINASVALVAQSVILEQHHIDALASFTYNIGLTAFSTSTMLRYINQDDFYEAGLQFSYWRTFRGRTYAQLVRRRHYEYNLWYGGLYYYA